MKLLIIGLDCAAPQLVFEDFRKELPHLDALMREGVYGELRSTIPPITVPAWTCMLSSKDPGQHGVYGFRNRRSHEYDELFFANASYIREKMVWDYAGDRGLKSVLMGIPQTYPPRPVNGLMVGSFLTPDKNVDFTYPRELKKELDQAAEGNYIIDVENFRTADKDNLLDQIYTMTRRRFKAVRHLLQNKAWDFFMFVEMGTDRIHHGFWRYHDSGHRLYQPDSPYRNAIRDYYRYIDARIGEILVDVDSDTAVMVVSDHGAKKMDGAICINQWLIQKGYLVLKTPVADRSAVKPDMIDWRKTRVWGEGGYYARVFFNVKGREPEGIILPEEYPAFRNKVKAEIEAIADDKGKPLDTKVYVPEEIYVSVTNIPPDLIVYFGNLDWRSAGTVGHESIHLFENDTGPDDANHAEYGIFILKAPADVYENAGWKPGERIESLKIYDVAPTILDLLGVSIPPDMIGRALTGRGSDSSGSGATGDQSDRTADYTDDEAEKIQKRLADLGYL